ncbi:MAG: MoaD/ThiS family protein [Gammaproteobacteria bacterium]|jgi:sulfur-carrier protein|nr:MoaD/ThiS family protein [Gammaproteobacteria bacterium]MBT4492296.1 MoaD/ThiS family protein [Gammaproteobacteria bacterium]
MQISLTGPLRSAAGDAASLEIEAKTIRELLKKLVAQYPLMDEYLEQGIAVSVDGTMYRDDWDVSIPPGVEVVLLPRIQGG